MPELNEVYKCNVCGNIVEILHGGVGTLVCCNEPMELLDERTKDAGLEKHVPVIEKTNSGVNIKVGSIPHPMEEKHYIEWVELFDDNNIQRKFLEPGQKPEVQFISKGENMKAREYCSIHGLWKTS